MIPNNVYVEAGLAAYDDKQLITELHKRNISEHTILSAFYALDAIADHRTEVQSELHSQDL